MAKFQRPACTRASCRATRRNEFKQARRQGAAAGQIIPWANWAKWRFVDPGALKRMAAQPSGKIYFKHEEGRLVRIREIRS